MTAVSPNDAVPAGLPAPAEVADIIGSLISRETTATACGCGDLRASVVAVYEESETGRPLYAVLADLSFTAFTAAALTMIPPGGARDVVAEGELTSTLEENAAEVFNVVSRVFNGPGRPHVKLRGTFQPDDCPADAWKLTRQPQVAYCIEATVAGYGTGVAQLSTLSVADRAR